MENETFILMDLAKIPRFFLEIGKKSRLFFTPGAREIVCVWVIYHFKIFILESQIALAPVVGLWSNILVSPTAEPPIHAF